MHPVARALATGGLLLIVLGGAQATAQTVSAPAPGALAPLDVPFLAQGELLCGGAAAAMVERWWGRRSVYATDFAALVRPAERGIRTTELAAEVRAQGWRTEVFDGTPALLREHLERGEPVIALIQVAPLRFHYVVVLAWSADTVTYHDPARAPSRRVAAARFIAAWHGASDWAMVIRPGAPGPLMNGDRVAQAVGPAAISTTPCDSLVHQAIDNVVHMQFDDAYAILQGTRIACPSSAVVLREMAGVRFKQRRLTEADSLARLYSATAPHDSLGWELLAASRYLEGDGPGALRAWNQIGRPRIDLLRVDGADRTRFDVYASAIRLPDLTVLTPWHLTLARRRLGEIPALSRGSVNFQPVNGGLVEVRATVAERPLVDPLRRLLVGNAVRALAQAEVGVDVASPTGGGELLATYIRWAHVRPRVALRLDAPVTLGIPGLLSVEGAWNRYRIGLDSAAAPAVDETERVATVGFGAWITPILRPEVAVRYEKWSGARDFLTLRLGAEFRSMNDRFVLLARGARAWSLTEQASYRRGSVNGRWTSSLGLGQRTVTVRLGADAVSPSAPAGAWPVAGGSLAFSIPLRGHNFSSGASLAAESVGRTIFHGGLSLDQPVYHMGVLVLAVGGFLDGVQLNSPPIAAIGDRTYLDAGGGLRLGIADGRLGVIRFDLATGLLDRSTAFSVGVQRTWPVFPLGAW
jgi:hypothetical protein